MSTNHAVKTMALEAYAQRRLSAAGSARVTRHLDGCDECRQALAAIESYEHLRLEAQQEAVPELAWERLERALAAQDAGQSLTSTKSAVATPPRMNGKVIALAWPILAIAATVLLGLMALKERPAPVAQRRIAPPAARPAEEARIQGVVTLVAGAAEIEVAGLRTAVTLGQPVAEDARIFTGKDAEVHLALAGGGGLVVEAASDLRLARLREHSVELMLSSGSVYQRVRKLAEGERYEVLFASYTARVRGTGFRVAHLPAGGAGNERSQVIVHEGRVAVYQGSLLIADLEAGQSWDSQANLIRDLAPERSIHGMEPQVERWANLTLPAAPNVGAWHLAGARLSARAELAMRVPAGDLTLTYEDLRGRKHAIALWVAPEGSNLSEQEIRSLVAAQNDPMGHLDPEQIAPVVRAGLDSLRRCYERGLKRDPSLVGKLVLSIRVAPDGHVVRSSLTGAEQPGSARLPLEVESCIQGEARAWLFPKPIGGSVVFEVPLNLKTH